MSKYSNTAAVGQINDMACWAACLKWWYKAEMSINASQTALWDLYKHLELPQGGMSDTGIQHIISQNAMKSLPFLQATDFTAARVAELLNSGAIYTAYSRTGDQKKHVNVIYKIVDADSAWASVWVMEPQFSSKGDGTWRGKREKRSLSDYNMQGSVYAGVRRTRWEAWLAS